MLQPFLFPVRGRLSSKNALFLFNLKHLKHIAWFDVVGIFQNRTALHTSADFFDIVFESPQRGNGCRADDNIVAGKTCKKSFAKHAFRSEERRVGKECRSRGWTYD